MNAPRLPRNRLAALLSIAMTVSFAACRKEPDAEPTHEKGGAGGASDEAAAFAVEHSPSGEAIVVLSPEALAASGIVTAVPITRDVVDEVAAFGELVADPARSAMLRAPLAGTLITEPGNASAWPAIGARVEAGAPLALLAPRVAPLAPAERADLDAKVALARGELQALAAQLAADRAALERARSLNAQDKGVSDQAVEAAAALVQSDEARLAGAKAGVAALEKVAGAHDLAALEPLPLVAPRDGEVLALFAQPGESVEAGQELARIGDFGELFADVRLPAELAGASLPTKARVVTSLGIGEATIVGLAPDGDRIAPRLRLRVRDPGSRLRPGLAVTAWLARDAAPRRGLALPAAAVVRYASRSWIYVETAPRRYARRPLTIVRTEGETVLVAAEKSGLAGDAHVVTIGAMTLLSQEQLAAGGGEGE